MQKSFILIILLFSLIGCSKDEKGSPSSSAPVTYTFVHGDPEVVIKDSKTETFSPITKNNVSEFEGYEIIGVHIITRESTFNSSTYQEAFVHEFTKGHVDKEDNDKPTAQINSQRFFSEEISYEGSLHLLYYTYLDGIKTGFVFSNDQSKGIIAFYSGGRTGEVNTVHLSHNKEEGTFSLLIAETNKLGKVEVLTALYLKKPEFRHIARINPKKTYQYLDESVLIQWDQSKKVTLNLCTKDYKRYPRYKDFLEQAVNNWAINLVGRLEIEIKVLEDFPPFSDLNTQCVYHFDDYEMTDARAKLNTLAYVLPVADRRQGRLVDADLYIWKNEFEKSLKNSFWIDQSLPIFHPSQRKFRELYIDTLEHEIGHFLGLGHQFSGIKSIMSYDDDAKFSEYDRKAIQFLYPEK